MKKKLFVLAAVIALVAVATVCLVACAPSTPEKAKEKFDKESGYIALPISISNDQKEDGVTGMFGAMNIPDGEYLFAIWFNKTSEASENMAEYKKFMVEELGISEEKLVFKRSGKVIYAATEGAEKIFKAL